MSIKLLDSNTIDKIAAGEVIERPASIVKELCENSIDAGCTAITCEIKEGGTSFIRITDNGKGIPKEDIATAFLRHATSKITSVDDLSHIYSLGFRGEALASICAVSKVEMLTKTVDDITGIQYIIEGGVELSKTEVGVPDGTTVIVRSLFYNIPARRKFLKSNSSETSAITEIVQNLALSHPEVSFKYVTDNKEKFHTAGNGNVKDIVYRIYGRDIAKEVQELSFEAGDIRISGLIGSPHVGRGTRSFETSFVNNRYVVSDCIYKSVEEAYKLYLMQHKFPFFVLNINVPPDTIDINVHPAKREIKFLDSDKMSDFIYNSVKNTLTGREMLKSIELVRDENIIPDDKIAVNGQAAKIESNTIANVEEFVEPIQSQFVSTFDMDFEDNVFVERKYETVNQKNNIKSLDNIDNIDNIDNTDVLDNLEHLKYIDNIEHLEKANSSSKYNIIPTEFTDIKQLDLFEERIISKDNQKEYEIIGQLFDTYWLFRYKNELLIMDQHAAHEKIKYEHLIEQFKNKEILSQNLLPAMVMRLSSKEMECYRRYAKYFTELGFISEEFGDSEVNVRSVPLDLYDCNAKDLFLGILDELLVNPLKGSPELIHSKLATTACKSAVKGNTSMSKEEANALIEQLLTLDNPYHCPHGRPTIISISKQELEKKFSRIV